MAAPAVGRRREVRHTAFPGEGGALPWVRGGGLSGTARRIPHVSPRYEGECAGVSLPSGGSKKLTADGRGAAQMSAPGSVCTLGAGQGKARLAFVVDQM